MQLTQEHVVKESVCHELTNMFLAKSFLHKHIGVLCLTSVSEFQ